MRIVMIGSGNVATVIGKKISASGHVIMQIFSRNPKTAIPLAEASGAEICLDPALLHKGADCYIIAVSDAAIPAVAGWLRLNGEMVVHTAGSVSMDVLRPCSSNYGVLYPLQSIRKETAVVPEIPFLVDANNEGTKSAIISFAKSFSGEVGVADDLKRSRLHLAAVMLNNFTNHLYRLEADFCEAEGIDFNLLKPLIRETTGRLDHNSPKDVQTGPAVRKDLTTIEKHENMLVKHPQLLELYRIFTAQIMNGYFFFFFFLLNLMSTS
jgi:predicted short-subunit dehydrogenase-like oxidoreductase (DUF2520 family)